jgi:hypothetical protein
VTIIGWNLDIASSNPDKFFITVDNAKSGKRKVPANFFAYQGEYAISINLSSNGIPLTYYDSKIVFEGYEKPFEILVLDSIPSPVQTITMSGQLYALDHETFSSNETGTKNIDRSFTLKRGEGLTTRRLVDIGVGDEVWSTVDIAAACAPDGSVEFKFFLKLFESTHVPNEDLDGYNEPDKDPRFVVQPDSTKQYYRRVNNTDEGGDFMELTLSIKNTTRPG